MRDPNITSRILAAIDRSEDPHLHIDILREADLEQSEEIQRLRRDVTLLQDAERGRLTETGAWRVVKAKLDEETVDWVKWAVRGVAGLIGTGLLSAAAVIIHIAWKRLQ